MQSCVMSFGPDGSPCSLPSRAGTRLLSSPTLCCINRLYFPNTMATPEVPSGQGRDQALRHQPAPCSPVHKEPPEKEIAGGGQAPGAQLA